MKQYVTKNGWSQKMIRITSEYERLCLFIDYWSKENEKNVVTIYDEIFNYSLDKLFQDGFHYRLSDSYSTKIKREPKGFLLSKETKEKFDKEFKQYSALFNDKFPRNLTLGEFAELLMYIYCQDNFSQKHKDFVNMEWGITDLRELRIEV